MELIKIGIYSFNAEFLREKTSKEAADFMPHIPGSVVLQAWKIANPKSNKKTKKAETDEPTEEKA